MRASLSSVVTKFTPSDQFYELERSIVEPAYRQSAEMMEELLHPEFVELGSSGRVYDRQDMIEMLTAEVAAEVLIRDFKVHRVNPSAVLVTYRSIGQSGNEARRSSLWVRVGDRWQIRFHQGTRIENSWGRVS